MDSKLVYLINFATKEFYESQKKLNASALKFGVDKVVSYKREDIIKSSFYKENKDILDQKRGAGFWLWKPYIILDLLEKVNDGDVVIYADSGIEVIKELEPLIELCIKKNDVLLFCDGGEHRNRDYTKRDCFIMMDCDSEEYWNSVQCLASFHLYIRNNSCVEFLKKWLFFCRNKHILTDVENICGKDNFSEFKDHRHDQSVLSLLAHKTKKEIFRDPTQWGNHLKMKEFRINGEFCLKKYTSIHSFNNSPYGTLLNHHRERKISLLNHVKFFLWGYFNKIMDIVKIFNFCNIKKVDFVCPLCGSENSSYEIVIAGESTIIACKKCTNAWTHPAPSVLSYVEEDFHGQFNYKSVHDLPEQWKEGVLKQVKVIKHGLMSGGKILEIGCGQGWLLEELKKEGFNVVGIEPSVSGAVIASQKGLNIVNANFPSETLKDKKYDLIILAQVFEHIKDPRLFIDELLAILSKNGKILFVQTNWKGLMPRFFKSSWYAWVPEQHYWHFTPKGLAYILKKNGFLIEDVEYYSLEHRNHILSRVTKIIPNQGDQFHMLVSIDN